MKTDGHDSKPADLLKIAAALLDGEDVDWDTAMSGTPASYRSLLANLQAISQVTTAHRREPWSTPETWGPLDIRERIGAGAFGEVFRAWDPRLAREVALKLFRPDRSRLPDPQTGVVEEGRLLAQVHHPNVVGVYGAELHDGLCGVWMELIEGTTLEDVVLRDGALSCEEALVIGRHVCRAVAALHQAGIIHRDIKAHNVVRERGGRIVLMDLGVSCEIDTQAALGPYGTPLYAAPEVLAGQEASRQSDLYSVGVLLYRLVTGDFPVNGASLADLQEAHRSGRVQLLQDRRPDLPAGFVALVEKALARDPERRFATAGELEQALAGAQAGDRPIARRRSRTRVATTVAVILLAAVGIVTIGQWLIPRLGIQPEETAVPVTRPSLAVLPFENLGSAGENEYLAAAVAKELIDRLAQIRQIDILSHGAVARYAGRRVDPRELGRDLGVDYLLEGALLVGEDRLRLDARFIETVTGFHVWADHLNGSLDDLGTFQEVVVARIGSALGIASDLERAQLDSRRWTENAEAYRCYLVGRELAWSGWSPQNKVALQSWFERALAHDPDYAPALAALAIYSMSDLTRAGGVESGFIDRALALARRAREIDPTLALAWRAEGRVLRASGRPGEAREVLEHALALDRSLGVTRGTLYHCYYDDSDERDRAFELMREGTAIDPYQLQLYPGWSRILIDEGRFAEADSIFERARSLMPDEPALQYFEAEHLWREQRFKEAITAYRDLVAAYPETYRAYLDLYDLLSSLGQQAAADSVCALAVARWPDDPQTSVLAARNALALGRHQKAEEQLRSVLTDDEDYPLAWNYLAHNLLAQGRREEAEAAILEIPARWPDCVYFYDFLCGFFETAGDPASLERWAREMTERFPELATARSWLADAFRMQGDHARAAEQYRKALAIRSITFWDHRYLCWSLANLERVDDALSEARRWVDRRPMHADGWYLFGDLQRTAGDLDAAAAAYERVLHLPSGRTLADSVRAQLVAMQEP